MEQYINKSAIVAEIERIKKEECPIDTYEGRMKLFYFERFLSFIDTIETKEVSYNEALERARKEYKNHEAFNGFREMLVRIFPELRENNNEDDLEKEIIRVSKNEYFDFTDWKSIARHFYELGLKAQKGEKV